MASRRWPASGEVSVDEAAPVRGADELVGFGADSPGQTGELTEFTKSNRGAGELPRRLETIDRLFHRGPRSVSGGDLLGLVLRTGGRGRPARDVALELVRRHRLSGLARLSPNEWLAQSGVGQASAARLAAVFELGRRAWGDADAARPRVASPGEAWQQVRYLGRLRKEHLVGLYLDAQNGLLCRETISVGSLNTTRTHPREIFFPAVENLALGFILAHNHPSGCRDPSSEDIEFTHGVRRAAELMGIDLYDHLIVTRTGYTSLRERGVL